MNTFSYFLFFIFLRNGMKSLCLTIRTICSLLFDYKGHRVVFFTAPHILNINYNKSQGVILFIYLFWASEILDWCWSWWAFDQSFGLLIYDNWKPYIFLLGLLERLCFFFIYKFRYLSVVRLILEEDDLLMTVCSLNIFLFQFFQINVNMVL